VHANELTLAPSLNVSQTAAHLIFSSRRERNLITEFSPGVDLELKTPRTQTDVEYSYVQRMLLRNYEQFDEEHQYRIASNLELIEKRANIKLLGNQERRYYSPLNTITLKNELTFNELYSDYEAYAASIDWKQPVAHLLVGELQGRVAQNKYNSIRATDNESHQIEAVLRSGDLFQRMFWRFDAKQDRIRYTNSARPYTRTAQAAMGVRLIRRLSLSAKGGYEQNPQMASSNKFATSGYFAEAMLSALLGRDMKLDALYGRRSYGETYRVSGSWEIGSRTEALASIGKSVIGKTWTTFLKHEFRKSSIELIHSEDLTSRTYIDTQSVFENVGDELTASVFTGEVANIKRRVLQTIEDGVFVKKLSTAKYSIRGKRNLGVLQLHKEHRVFQEQNFFEESYGVNFSWTLKVFSAGSIATSALFEHGGYGRVSKDDNIYEGSASYTHRLSKRVKAKLEYYYLKRDSSNEIANQRHHLVTASIQLKY